MLNLPPIPSFARFDSALSDLAIRRIQTLKLYKGEWAGKPIQLLDWQDEWLRRLLATVDGDGLRLYREAFLFLPARQGKTTLASCLAMFFLMDNAEPGAEVYSAGPTKEQAAIAYQNCKQMIAQDEYLSSLLKWNDNTKTIRNLKTQSVYRALSADADYAEGFDANFIICDELHAWPKPDLFDVLKSRMGNRRQPLLLSITTAGKRRDPQSICFQRYELAKRIRDSKAAQEENPRFLPLIFEALPTDDAFDPETWKKAQPALGHYRKVTDLEMQASEAKQSPLAMRRFQRYCLNLWLDADDSWLDLDQWERCRAQFSADDLKGQECYVGVDLSTNVDLTSVVAWFPQSKSVLPFFWVPRAIMAERAEKDFVPYPTWAAAGHIETCPGATIDQERIREKINELGERFVIKAVGIDKWNAAQLASQLQGDGINVGYVRTNGYQMTPALKELERLIQATSLRHDGNPCLDWCVANARIAEGTQGDIRIIKSKQRERIDGAVALAAAMFVQLARASKGEQQQETVYTAERGIRFL